MQVSRWMSYFGHRIGPRLVGAAVLCAAVAGASGSDAFVWPNVPERVARSLDSSDPAERRLAAERLIDLPKSLAEPLVKKAMGDPDAEVRLRAARAAIHFRLRRAGDLVIPWFSENDSRLRLAAADVVHASPTDRSVNALARVLSDADVQVRLAAATAMGASGTADAVSPLLGHLDDSAPEVRLEVARALARLGDKRAVVPLVGKIQDTVPEVRRVVARALGDLEDDRAVSALMLAVQDASFEVQIEAVTALGKLKSSDATLSISELLESTAPDSSRRGSNKPIQAGQAQVRVAALRALGEIGSPDAIRALIAALNAESPLGRVTPARDALVTVGKPAVGALIDIVERSGSRNATAGAAHALGAIGASEARPILVRAMQRGSLPVRSGLSALMELGDPAVLPVVLELVDDADPAVRRQALRTAAALLNPKEPDGRPVDPIAGALADVGTPLDEKVLMVELLGRTGSPRGREILVQMAGADNAELRAATLGALGELGNSGDASVDAALLKALDDELSSVRFSAALSLSRVGTPRAANILLKRLLVSSEQDRGALGIALSGALSRVEDPTVAKRIGAAVGTAPAAARDALIEGLGRMPTAEAGVVLSKLSTSAIDDRRKVAEALAGHATQLARLRQLAGDPDATVRANAVWSLGKVAQAEDIELLNKRSKDPDVAVAGNAIASLGRLSVRLDKPSEEIQTTLCGALTAGRPYVRANALAALTLAGQVRSSTEQPLACQEGIVRSLLARDEAESVRIAAARHLWGRATSVDKLAAADRRALARCGTEDRNAAVAEQCSRPPQLDHDPSEVDDVLVFVAPDGESAPVGRAPFALVRADGLMRLGVSDRRGALFEAQTPSGQIHLAVPAALVK